MAPKRKDSGSLNTSRISATSNNSKISQKSNSKLSAKSNKKHQRDDSVEIRRKRLQKRVREDEPVLRTGKGKPVDEVRKLDEELEELDAKYNRLQQLINKAGANAAFLKQ